MNPNRALSGQGRVERAARVRFRRHFGRAQRGHGVTQARQTQSAASHHAVEQLLGVARRLAAVTSAGDEQESALVDERFGIELERVVNPRP